MARVLLLYPEASGRYPEEIAFYPLVLPLLSSALRAQGMLSKVFFEHGFSLTPETLAELIVDVDIVGVSCMYVHVPRLQRLCGMIKDKHPEVVIVAGGPQPTLAGEDLLNQIPGLDCCVVGEGELTFPELVLALRNQTPLELVKGICFRRHGRIIRTTRRRFINDLEHTPVPEFSVVPFASLGSGNGENQDLTLSLETSRGCPFDCIFCSANKIGGRRYRAKTPERILLEIHQVVAATKSLTTDRLIIRFIDNNFLADEHRIVSLCKLLIDERLEIEWSCNCRFDLKRLEILQLMYEAGCRRVFVGAEVGYEGGLQRIGKGLSLGRLGDFVTRANHSGIFVVCGWIIGFPWETVAEVSSTVRMALTICELAPEMVSCPVYVATPYPGTALRQQVEVTAHYNDLFASALPFNHDNLTDVDIKCQLFLSRIGVWLIRILHQLNTMLREGIDHGELVDAACLILPTLLSAEPPYHWDGIVDKDQRLHFLKPLENPPRDSNAFLQLLTRQKQAIFDQLESMTGR